MVTWRTGQTEGLRRRLYRRGGGSLRAGRLLTSFEYRSIPEDQRAGLDPDSPPTTWQQTEDIIKATTVVKDGFVEKMGL